MTVDLEKLIHEEMTINVTITHVKRGELRLWVARHLVRMAVKVAGCQLKEHEAVGVIVQDKIDQLVARNPTR